MRAIDEFTFVLDDGKRELATRRRNPDGTLGGWVAASARVHETAVVAFDAVVHPGAVVGPGDVVHDGDIVA